LAQGEGLSEVIDHPIALDKTEVARRQLGAALALFLDDLDPVAVHSLACSGGEVAEHMAFKAGEQPFSTHTLAMHPDIDSGRLRGLRNQFWNAFKHATTQKGLDRNDEQLLADFRDDQNDHALFIGWYDYRRAAGWLPLEAQAFQVWYYALYPEKLRNIEDARPAVERFGDLTKVSRTEAKYRLRTEIARLRQDGNVMTHPLTEPVAILAKNDR
jgi:hypothetical protein